MFIKGQLNFGWTVDLLTLVPAAANLPANSMEVRSIPAAEMLNVGLECLKISMVSWIFNMWNNTIDLYRESLQLGKTYMIRGATVAPIKEEYLKNTPGTKMDWTIGRSTYLWPLKEDEQCIEYPSIYFLSCSDMISMVGSKERIGETPSMKWAMRLRVALFVAQTLEYCTSKRVIVYNLNPHNIFFDDDCNPRLSSFGLVQRVELGRVVYSPDIVYDAHECREIVYSFGCLLLVLLTGREIAPSEGLDMTRT